MHFPPPCENSESGMINHPFLVRPEKLRAFCVEVLRSLGVSEEDATTTADVLVEADLQGIDSHGMARLNYYARNLINGTVVAKPNIQTIWETVTTATLDGGGGLGPPISVKAMKLALAKAKEHFVGMIAVRNSNHYGIAGYYSALAIQEGMIGFSATNSLALVVPTFGSKTMLGTNPLSLAIPGGKRGNFVLDMATSTVPIGKVEIYDRQGNQMPHGWATDEFGQATADPGLVLHNIYREQYRGGGLLPLGGEGEKSGGHKGYGLAVAVEIISALLAGAACSDLAYPKDADGKPLPAGIGHFFGALRIDGFRDPALFRQDLDDLLERLRQSAKATGCDRIYTAGEKESEIRLQRSRYGIPLHAKVSAELEKLALELGIPTHYLFSKKEV
jgi:L-2-hydroxycarboxylate dehydrogenase (NAD+)